MTIISGFQKLAEIEYFGYQLASLAILNATFWGDFQTLWRMVVWISNVNFHILGDFQTLCKTKEMNLIVYMSLLTTLIGEEIIGRENFSPGTPPFVKQWNRKENENTAINELETFCLGVLYLHSVWKSSKKGAFNIASEASCTYILSVQKFMKNTQNIKYSISASFWKPDIMVKQCYQTGQL